MPRRDANSPLGLPNVSADLRAWLESQDVRRDPKQTCTREALARLLRELRYPVLDSALDFEAEWGGVVWGGEDPVDQVLLGPYAVLTSEAESFARPKELPLVTIGFGPGDAALYIDEAGQIWHQDLVEMPAPKRIGESFSTVLDRLRRGA